MKYIILTILSITLTGCSGKSSDPPPPPAGSVLGTSCEEYTLIETVADGNGGTTTVETDRSPDCGWNPPEAGTVVETSCDVYTLIEQIADGEYGTTEQRTERSPECGWNPPEAGTESGDFSCEGYDKYQDFHDGEYGIYSELQEENSYDCGYEDPVAVFDEIKSTGDRFDPIVFSVSYEQFGEPYYVEDNPETVIVDWKWAETDSTIGHIERIDDNTLHIYGDGRLGEGIILLNDEEFVYSIVEEPVCAVENGIDCMGYRASPSIGRAPYYGEEDTRIVQWELSTFDYTSVQFEEGIAGEYFEGDHRYSFWQNRVNKINEIYARSGIYVEIVLKHVYWGRHFGLDNFASIAREQMSDSDIALGYGAVPSGTCGVAYGNTKFIEGRPVVGLSACGVNTDMHEIGHAIGLAHGPENQAYQRSGYTFPEFGHGWNDYCGDFDDIMSYGYNAVLFTNSKQTCEEQFPSNRFDSMAGDRSYRDTAYATNRVRYAVALIHKENDKPSEADKVLKAITTPYYGPIITD